MRTMAHTVIFLGLLLVSLSHAVEDPQALKRGCNSGVARDCTALGQMYEQDGGERRNRSLALNYYRRACRLGDAMGCTSLGLAYRTEGDVLKAESYFRKGCEGGDARGCFFWGMLYLTGERVKEPSRKKEVLERVKATLHDACRQENMDACFFAGTIHRKASEHTDAFRLYSRACHMGHGRACSTLGYMYTQGTGTGRNLSKATELFKRSCEMDDATGCFNLGLMYIKDGREDYSSAVEPFRKSCELGLARACFNLGVIYSLGRGVERNHSVARGLFERACGLRDGEGCFNAGIMYLEGREFDVPRAMELLKTACNMKHKRGCEAYQRLKKDGLSE